MEKYRLREAEYDVVLGLCPGCQLWQLDYTYESARSYTTITVPAFGEYTLDGALQDSDTPIVDASGFLEVVEDALQEHLAECPHLQRALFEF